MHTKNFDDMNDAQLIGHAMDTKINVNGQPCTLFEFLELNWTDDESNITFAEVRELFALSQGASMQIKEWKITKDL